MAKVELQFGELGGGGKYNTDSFTATSSYHTFNVGFAPKYVVIYAKLKNYSAGTLSIFRIDVDAEKADNFQNGAWKQDLSSWLGEVGEGKYIEISGTTIQYKAPNSYYESDVIIDAFG